MMCFCCGKQAGTIPIPFIRQSICKECNEKAHAYEKKLPSVKVEWPPVYHKPELPSAKRQVKSKRGQMSLLKG